MITTSDSTFVEGRIEVLHLNGSLDQYQRCEFMQVHVSLARGPVGSTLFTNCHFSRCQFSGDLASAEFSGCTFLDCISPPLVTS